MAQMPRLKQKYAEEVKAKLAQRFGIDNDMAVPRLTKVVVNMGVQGAVENKGRVDTASKELAMITGQGLLVMLAGFIAERSGDVRYGWVITFYVLAGAFGDHDQGVATLQHAALEQAEKATLSLERKGDLGHQDEVRHQRQDHQPGVLERLDDLLNRQAKAHAQHAGDDEHQHR